jgi:hypothetical protein
VNIDIKYGLSSEFNEFVEKRASISELYIKKFKSYMKIEAILLGYEKNIKIGVKIPLSCL